tara:strand:+ start:1075 stop:1239 length:165 start_codon:yes stop_codon:yes gene_type:complete
MIDIRLKKLASSLINCGSSYWEIENAIRYSKLEDYEKRYLLKILIEQDCKKKAD